MSRIRYIKPGFFKNPALAKNDPLARLLFEGLWCMADREGRLEDSPELIKIECLPYDDCDIEELLGQLQHPRGPHTPNGFITRYQVDGVPYIQINGFTKHQKPHIKEASSCIPGPERADPVQAPEKPVPPARRNGRSGSAKERAFSPLEQANPVQVPEKPVQAPNQHVASSPGMGNGEWGMGNGNGAAIFDLPEPDQTLAILRQEPTKGKRLTVEKAIRECPDTSSPSVALEYVNWQDEEAEKAAAGNKQAKVQSNWVAGYVNAMHRSRDRGFHKKASVERPLEERMMKVDPHRKQLVDDMYAAIPPRGAA